MRSRRAREAWRRARAMAVVMVAAFGAARAHAADAPPAPGQEPSATSSRAASAQNTEPLSMDEVLKSVEEAFPLLRAAALEAQAADGELLAAEGGFDPSWKTKGAVYAFGGYPTVRAESVIEQPTGLWGTKFFAAYRLGLGDFAIYDGKARTADYGEARIGASIPLLRDGSTDRRRTTLRRAELGVDIARLGLEQQRLEIRRAAASKYWDWVAAGRRVEVTRQLLAIAVTRDAGLSIRANRGDIPTFERTENARAIQQRQAAVLAAERALQQTTYELSLYLRDARGEPLSPSLDRLPPAFPEPPATPAAAPQDVERQALARRPEVRRTALQAEQQSLELRLAENQRLPALDLTVAGYQGFGPVPARNSTLVDYPNPASADSKLTKPGLEASIMLDIPLLNRSASGKRDAAMASLARVQEQARYARDKVVTDVRDARSAITFARERLDVVRKEIAVADELATLEARRFELGDSTLLLVNLRETAAAEAKVKEVDVLAEYYKAEAAFRAATAAGAPGSGGTPPG